MREPAGLRPFLIRIFIIVLVIGTLAILYFGAVYFLLLFTGTLLAIFWRRSAKWIAKKTNLSFKIVLPLLILLNIGSIAIFFWLAAPSIAEQMSRLAEKVPEVLNQVRSNLGNSEIGRKILEKTSMDEGLPSADKALGIFSSTLTVLINVLLILAFALFLVSGPKLYINGILYLIPKKHQNNILKLMSELTETLHRWFVGKIVDMASIFVLTIIGLWLLDVPLVLTLSLIAFLFSFVPNIGPIISAVPALAITFLDSPQKALYVGLLYLGIQMFESYFITPAVQRKASFVPPLLLLLVQFLMARFFGVMGLFLSTPILITLMVLVRKLYVEDVLGNYSLKNNEIE